MINYTWDILAVTKKTINNVNDVVVTVVWQKIGTDENGHSGSFKQACNFNIIDVNTDSFVQFENLKKEDVIEWIKLNTDEESINQFIDNEIQKSKTNEVQIQYSDLPWNRVNEVEVESQVTPQDTNSNQNQESTVSISTEEYLQHLEELQKTITKQ